MEKLVVSPFLSIICLDYILKNALDNNKNLGLTIEKRKSTRYPETYMTDSDYADDLAINLNNDKNAETMFHNFEKTAEKIGLKINTNKTDICL